VPGAGKPPQGIAAEVAITGSAGTRAPLAAESRRFRSWRPAHLPRSPDRGGHAPGQALRNGVFSVAALADVHVALDGRGRRQLLHVEIRSLTAPPAVQKRLSTGHRAVWALAQRLGAVRRIHGGNPPLDPCRCLLLADVKHRASNRRLGPQRESRCGPAVAIDPISGAAMRFGRGSCHRPPILSGPDR